MIYPVWFQRLISRKTRENKNNHVLIDGYELFRLNIFFISITSKWNENNLRINKNKSINGYKLINKGWIKNIHVYH